MMGGVRMVIVTLSFDIVLVLCMLGEGLLGMVMLLVICSAECGRTPMDLVEGESELVSGFNTEYRGRIFVCFFLGEYIMIIVMFSLVLGIWSRIILIGFSLICWV